MGTRRPLVVQMVNSPEHTEPCCSFREEGATTGYSAPVDPMQVCWHIDHEMMLSMCVYQVCHEIVERTRAHLATLPEGKNVVSAVPLVMKVEYAYCPDLTLLDTPGMVLQTHSHAWLFDTVWAGQVLKGDQPGTAGEIKQMVLASLCVSAADRSFGRCWN